MPDMFNVTGMSCAACSARVERVVKKVPGTDMTYAEYVGAHSSEWTNIMTNLGFYWADNANAPAEPDWNNLDWATLTQKAK